ncbi:MAG: LLM class flavin-dependent oxidoreductase [Chloroflexota bacterium]|nr:MAG: hypothetical protein DLM70_18170 [Chloroflexota bacterium]
MSSELASYLPERFGLGISNCRSVENVLTGVEMAEQRGAEIAFLAEDINCRDAFQLAAMSAARTTRIRLATGVVNPYTRNPTSLAMAITTLDQISHGRAVLGLGTGSPALIQEQMGIVHRPSIGAMREAAEIIRALLRGDTVDYTGSRFVYRGASLGIRPVQEHVPIFFAAMGPRTLRLAGQIADGVLLNVGASTTYIRWAVDRVRAGAAEVGRDSSEVTIAAWMTVYVSDDREITLARAREWLATVLSIPRQGELLLEQGGFDSSILPDIRRYAMGYPPHGGDTKRAADFVPPEMAEQMTLLGGREHVSARLAEYADSGVGLPVLPASAIESL